MPVETPRFAGDDRDSYVVPVATDRSRTVPVTLTTYLMHHSEYASQLTRNSVSSNVVGAAMEDVDVAPAPGPVPTKPAPVELEPGAPQPAERQ
jgi:hypothetical protein